MRCALVVFALAAIASAGCVDLANVAEDGCGNLVLNKTEDCDGSSQFDDEESTMCAPPGNANACFYTCDPMLEGAPTCPAGWGCGKDFRCRRPSADFYEAAGSPLRFSVDEFAVGDVDGDGHVDLIGNDLATITVRYGDGNGELPTEVTTLIQPPQGPVTYAHFDSDNRLDAIVPIGEGIFTLLGDRSRNLEPVPYSPFELPSDADVLMTPVESAPNNINTEMVVFSSRFFEFIDSSRPQSTLPLTYTIDDLVGKVPVGNLDQDAGGRNEFALAFWGANRVWVYSSTGTASDGGNDLMPTEIRQVTVPGTVDQGVHFADVNGDGLLDLLVSVTILGQSRVAVSYNVAGQLQLTAGVEAVFTRQEGALWPLAAGDIDGDGKADYVFEEAIGISDFGAGAAPGLPNGGIGVPTQIVPTAFISTDVWVDAAIGDFNKDGIQDVAVLTNNIDGVSFFLNIGIGIFNKFYVDTDRLPRDLRVGDFDGDLTLDVAFVEDGQGINPDEVSVIFGSPSGGPSQPVSMGKLGYVSVMQPVHSVTSLEGLDAITDLMVVSDTFPDAEAKTVSVLRGSSSRRMISPFTLFATDSNAQQPDIPRRAVVGRFSPDGDDVADVVALAEPVIDFEVPGGGDPKGGTPDLFSRLWMIPGKSGDGSLDSSNAAYFPMPGLNSFHDECATWVSGDIDGAANGRHELVGIDSNRDCYGFGGFGIIAPEPRLLVASTNEPGSGEPFSATIQQLTGEERVADNLVLRDLDADGDLDALVLFAGDISTDGTGGIGSIHGSRVLVVWNDNGQLKVQNTSDLVIAETEFLFDVQSIHLDADTTPELLILADGAVYVSWLDPDTKQYSSPEHLWEQYGGGRAGVGDFNGDGLDDIAYTVDNELVVLLQREAPPLGSQPESEEE